MKKTQDMAFKFVTRFTLHRFTSIPKQVLSISSHKIQSLSTTPDSLFPVPQNQSDYRKSISLANLLQRYGFPPSQLPSFLSKYHFLLNSDLNELERSLAVILSFKIPQKSFVSLIHNCPGILDSQFLRKWKESVPKFEEFGLSPSVITSVLEHCRRFQIDPDRFFERVVVLEGLGFSDSTVNRVLTEFPKVITMKEIEINRRTEFLVGIGISKDVIEWVFNWFPGILGFGVEDKLKPLLEEFQNLGFSRDEIREEILREPRILGMELGELSRCFQLLRSLKCREPIKEKIFNGGAFRAGFEVKLRVDCLCKHGLIRREAFKVLWKEPRLIIYEIEEIEKKIEFLLNRMRFDIGCLVEVPEYLGVNLEKQIIPRYSVIEFLSSKGGLGCDIGLKDLIKLSRLRFYNLYVKPYPECEKLFGRFAGDVVIQRQRHPDGLWKLFKPPSYPQSKEDVKNIRCFVESLV